MASVKCGNALLSIDTIGKEEKLMVLIKRFDCHGINVQPKVETAYNSNAEITFKLIPKPEK